MNILLAIDDSKFSDDAVRELIAQNQPRKTAVHLLHAVEPIELPYYPELGPPYPSALSDIQREYVKRGQELVERAAKKLRAAGLQVKTAVRQGHARSMIVDAAAKWRVNLIVMGSHGRTGIRRVLLGSVSEYVVRHAPCSVEIVRSRRRAAAR